MAAANLSGKDQKLVSTCRTIPSKSGKSALSIAPGSEMPVATGAPRKLRTGNCVGRNIGDKVCLIANLRKLTIMFITLLMAVSFAAPAFADTEGPVDGSFEVSVPPTINSGIGVFTDSSLSIAASSLVPLQTYYIKVSVTDNDSLKNINRLDLKLAYSANGYAPNENQFNNLPAGDPQSLLNVSWQRSLPSVVSFDPDGPTWYATSSTLPTLAELDNSAITAHDFIFAVTIGKVAVQTTGSDRWQVAAKVTDESNYTSYKYFSNNMIDGLPMDWYGEINTPGEVNWGKVRAGMGFEDDSAMQPVGDVTYTSNGNWAGGVRVKAENQAWAAGANSVSLKSAHNDATNAFSLKAGTTSQNAAVVPGDATTVDVFSGEITSEGGYIQDNYSLFLSLSKNITYPGIYTGAVSFLIANR